MKNFNWSNIDCFCFDVDSTVCIDEGIDQLAKYFNKENEVKNLTVLAMNGSMDFRTSLETRLNIINPNRKLLTKFIAQREKEDLLTPGIRELISLLHKAGKEVCLVSGGLKEIIEPIALQLSIPKENVFANILQFDKDGQYCGFDTSQPTSSQGGKGQVIGWLKTHRRYKVVMIGDGATDLEASPPADLFIGFGGNVVREEVRKRALLYFMHFSDLIDYFKNNSVI